MMILRSDDVCLLMSGVNPDRNRYEVIINYHESMGKDRLLTSPGICWIEFSGCKDMDVFKSIFLVSKLVQH